MYHAMGNWAFIKPCKIQQRDNNTLQKTWWIYVTMCKDQSYVCVCAWVLYILKPQALSLMHLGCVMVLLYWKFGWDSGGHFHSLESKKCENINLKLQFYCCHFSPTFYGKLMTSDLKQSIAAILLKCLFILCAFFNIIFCLFFVCFCFWKCESFEMSPLCIFY